MRSSFFYGILILCCLVLTTVEADKKWKVYETEEDKIKKKDEVINRKLEILKTKSARVVDTDSSEESDEEGSKKSSRKVEVNASKKEKLKNLVKQVDDEELSGEEHDIKNDKNDIKKGKDEPPQRKFIGRIEHGKVMVLRRKEDSNINQNKKDSEEDTKAKVCRKIKGGKKTDCGIDDDDQSDESSEGDDGKKSKKKIKYSIKFQHEKQKKKENNGDSRIMRMHKNGKKYGKIEDDDDASDEDESPVIKKRITYDDED